MLDPRCYGQWSDWLPEKKARVSERLKAEYLEFCFEDLLKSDRISSNNICASDCTTSNAAFWTTLQEPSQTETNQEDQCRRILDDEFSVAHQLWVRASHSLNENPNKWISLVKTHVKTDATDDECKLWQIRMKVPLRQVLLSIFEKGDLRKVANLSAMLWWSRFGVSIAMSSSFGERIASGGAWALNKFNLRSSIEQISQSVSLHMNKKIVEHVKNHYEAELMTELVSLK